MSKKQTHNVNRYSFVGENRSLLDQYEQVHTNANPAAISAGSICENYRASAGQNPSLVGASFVATMVCERRRRFLSSFGQGTKLVTRDSSIIEVISRSIM